MKVKKILPNNGTRMNQMVTGDFANEEVYENIKNTSLELQDTNSKLRSAFIKVGINPVDGTIPAKTEPSNIYNFAGAAFTKQHELISDIFANNKEYNVFDGANLNIFRTTMVEHFKRIAVNALTEAVNVANMEFTSAVKINVPEAIPTMEFMYADYYYRNENNQNIIFSPFSTVYFFDGYRGRRYYDDKPDALPDLSDYYIYNICDENTMFVSLIPRLETMFNSFKQDLFNGINNFRADGLTDEDRTAMYNSLILRFNACMLNLLVRLESIVDYLYEEADRIAKAGLPGVRGIDHNKLIASLTDTTTTEEIIDRNGNIISDNE